MLKAITMIALLAFVLAHGAYMRKEQRQQEWVDNCPPTKTSAQCIEEGKALMDPRSESDTTEHRTPYILVGLAALVLTALGAAAALVFFRNRRHRRR